MQFLSASFTLDETIVLVKHNGSSGSRYVNVSSFYFHCLILIVFKGILRSFRKYANFCVWVRLEHQFRLESGAGELYEYLIRTWITQHRPYKWCVWNEVVTWPIYCSVYICINSFTWNIWMHNTSFQCNWCILCEENWCTVTKLNVATHTNSCFYLLLSSLEQQNPSPQVTWLSSSYIDWVFPFIFACVWQEMFLLQLSH